MSCQYKGHNQRLSKGFRKKLVNISSVGAPLKKICALSKRTRIELDVILFL